MLCIGIARWHLRPDLGVEGGIPLLATAGRMAARRDLGGAPRPAARPPAHDQLVLDANPDFQPGWFNLGNYLQHMARIAESASHAEEAARLRDEARDAYTRAAAIDPESETGAAPEPRAAELAQ